MRFLGRVVEFRRSVLSKRIVGGSVGRSLELPDLFSVQGRESSSCRFETIDDCRVRGTFWGSERAVTLDRCDFQGLKSQISFDTKKGP